MSDWRKRRTTIFFDHPDYEDHWASLNRARALVGKPPIPHGEPLTIAMLSMERHEPLGVGYCQQCNEIMLVNDEQQKWCPACRAARKSKYTNKRKKRNED